MELDKLNSIHLRAHIVYSQLEQARKILVESGNESMIPQTETYYFELLNRLYDEEYPLAKLMEASDFVIHAEGPAASEQIPHLNIVNWLFSNVEKQIKQMAKSVLSLSINDINGAMKALDIRLTGMAPGSIYAGFSINPPQPMPLFGTAEEEQAISSIKDTITSLIDLPRFVTEDKVEDGLSEIFPDPAIRDSALVAAFNLSPTGKKGILSLGMSSPLHSKKTSTLNVMDRAVLRESIRNPVIKNIKKGSFIGEIRAIDLDRNRVNVRWKDGTLRCAIRITTEKAKQLIGKTVKVTGSYEENAVGKPRLMRVEEIKPFDNLPLEI